MDAHLVGIDLAQLLLKNARAEKQRPAKAAVPDTDSVTTDKDRIESRCA